ncbi:hypothetical protein BBP40_004568 [Aspergillus hancockii]|nr:hypothetical protein BBP40_004568 [Aspergillus hancockii]
MALAIDQGGRPIWLKQTVAEPCGLYAIMHAVCNVSGAVETETVLDDLMKSSDRVKFLEGSEIEKLHEKAAKSGMGLEAGVGRQKRHCISFVKHASQPAF